MMRDMPANAVFDPAMKGCWMNPDSDWGYDLGNRRPSKRWFRGVKMIYDFTPVYEHPLMWLQKDGTRIAAGEFKGSDEGSVPILAQYWAPKDGLLAYWPHDYGYQMGGLFFRYPGEKQFVFRRVTRDQLDALLRAQAQHDPAGRMGPMRAGAVWTAVRSLGWTVFHEWRQGPPVPVWPCDEQPDVDDGLPMGSH
jgi:hypothetical protein